MLHSKGTTLILIRFFLVTGGVLAFGSSYSQETFRAISIQDGDSIIYRTFCKQYFIMKTGNPAAVSEIDTAVPKNMGQRKFLKIHGNIQYNFSYQSLADTPFSQRDFAQHIVQTTFDMVVREKYPVRIILSTRQSNSPYFDDINDVNIQFNKNMFLNTIKENLLKDLPVTIRNEPLLQMQNVYLDRLSRVNALNSWLNNPARMQEMVEEKEKNLSGLPGLSKQLTLAVSPEDELRKRISEEIT